MKRQLDRRPDRTPARLVRRILGLCVVVAAPLALASPADTQCQIEMAKLLASDGAGNHMLGGAVALSGDTLVVGAAGWDGHGVAHEGAAYVFQRDLGGPNRWGEVARLGAGGTPTNTSFGTSVAIDGDTIAVGAPGFASTVGAVFVFGRDQGGPNQWGLVKRLDPVTTATFVTLGTSVAIWGDTIVAGAPIETGPPLWTSGAAYVFERNLGGADNWGFASKLVASDGNVGIGHLADPGLAIQGDMIVCGAYGAYNGPLESGAVYVFQRNAGGPGQWGETHKLAPADIAYLDFFGNDLSLSGSTLAVCSRSAGGSVYVFEYNGSWTQQQKLVGPFAFGNTSGRVALDADRMLAGAGYGIGVAYVFDRNAGGANNWGQVSEYRQSDRSPNDWFGFGGAVGVSGDTHVVGALFDDDLGLNSGSAFVFAPSPLPCPVSYCTAGTTTNGCNAVIETRGVPSATANGGFDLVVHGGEGARVGLFLHGVAGRAAIPWGAPGSGCTSVLCVAPPLLRGGAVLGTGALGQCDGAYTYDLNERWNLLASHNPGPGATVRAQLWFRDPGSPCGGPAGGSGAGLSDAVEFVVGP